MLVLLGAKLHVSRLYKLAMTSVSFGGRIIVVSRRLLGDGRRNCCVRAPGAGDKAERIPLDGRAVRTFRQIVGGHPGTRPFIVSKQNGFLFIGPGNGPGITVSCGTLFIHVMGGCGGRRVSGPLPRVAPRALHRAFYAELTDGGVGPGSLRCVVKRSGVDVAVG